MSLLYLLSTPINVGSLTRQVSVSALKLTSISLNYQDVYTEQGQAVLSICLVDQASGYPVNVMYQDASALAFAQMVESLIGAQLFSKLQADGKLAAGTLSTATDPSTPADPAPSDPTTPAAA